MQSMWGLEMGFLKKLTYIYNLYKTGELDSVEDFLKNAQKKAKTIYTEISTLEYDVKVTKRNLGQIRDTQIKKV